ncbi:hypothetical protein [Rheinheimera sp. 1928-s]|uniref:hypothetical protein n=1 Tax=Rheinheimera sp. 1928-s TaxID=3033803 RepID=UPI002630140C|nr:hypothetical protein [Rheinheimera sp. 1928-s]MDF3125398.1 hypothetical protein [Rheinheimera sp. 1928-s]
MADDVNDWPKRGGIECIRRLMMSYLKLFRKEALRHQYQTQEFGKSVIQQSHMLDKSIVIMFIAFGLLIFFALVFPFVSREQLNLEAHESNYFPIVSPVPVVVERHLNMDGSRINREQVIVQVRSFDSKSQLEQVDLLKSSESGTYFAMVNSGSTALAFQTIAKVLRINDDHLFFFSLTGTKPNQIQPGQVVNLRAGSLWARGKVHSVIGPFQQGRINVGIQLQLPYEPSVLHPSADVRLELNVKRNNFFALIKEG